MTQALSWDFCIELLLGLFSGSGIDLTEYDLSLEWECKNNVCIVFLHVQSWQKLIPSSRKQTNHRHNAQMKPISWSKGLTSILVFLSVGLELDLASNVLDMAFTQCWPVLVLDLQP